MKFARVSIAIQVVKKLDETSAQNCHKHFFRKAV
jgi:hypothetical protein